MGLAGERLGKRLVRWIWARMPKGLHSLRIASRLRRAQKDGNLRDQSLLGDLQVTTNGMEHFRQGCLRLTEAEKDFCKGKKNAKHKSEIVRSE
jgi:hypothetical protein